MEKETKKQVVTTGEETELSVEEKNLLSVAFKNAKMKTKAAEAGVFDILKQVIDYHINEPVVLPHWNCFQCFHIRGGRRFAKANRRTLVALPNQSQQRTKPMCKGGGEANVHSRHLLAQSRRRITTNAHYNCTTLKPAMQLVSPMQLQSDARDATANRPCDQSCKSANNAPKQ